MSPLVRFIEIIEISRVATNIDNFYKTHMNRTDNPYTPGAGTPPFEFAGREAVIESARVALERIQKGRPDRSQLLLGLRGVGKTVLLNYIFTIAEEKGFFTIRIEAPENGDLAKHCLPELDRILLRLSAQEALHRRLRRASAAIRNFAAAFRLSYNGITFELTPEPGIADTGNFEIDFTEMMRSVIEAAQGAGKAVALFVDEIQYLEGRELAALVVACHEVSQRRLPFIMFGAGLPQIAKLAGDAKSYAERLFAFPEIGSLDDDAAQRALINPAKKEGVDYLPETVDRILRHSHNYPYFLQEWGSHVWNQAQDSPINPATVVDAEPALVRHLDQSFFRVRFDRCKPVQQKYLRAMAELGPGPHKTGDIAAALKCEPSQLATTRAQLISLGMIWSQRHGETAFTVPLFDEFMKRQMPDLEPHVPRRRR